MVRNSFDHPAAHESRRRSPSFISEPIPLSAAGDAIVRGVTRRSRVTYAPRWVGTAIALRGVLQPLSEFALRHDKSTAEAVRRAEAESAKGDAGHPSTRVPTLAG
jgi:hypothetical protein